MGVANALTQSQMNAALSNPRFHRDLRAVWSPTGGLNQEGLSDLLMGSTHPHTAAYAGAVAGARGGIGAMYEFYGALPGLLGEIPEEMMPMVGFRDILSRAQMLKDRGMLPRGVTRDLLVGIATQDFGMSQNVAEAQADQLYNMTPETINEQHRARLREAESMHAPLREDTFYLRRTGMALKSAYHTAIRTPVIDVGS